MKKRFFIMDEESSQINPNNAFREYDSAEEAINDAKNYVKEILEGVYDSEWGIEEDERTLMARAVVAFETEYTRGGAIIRSNILYDAVEDVD